MDNQPQTTAMGGVTTPLTYGQKAVGLTFNPSNNPEVDKIKKLYAEIINFCYLNTLDGNGGNLQSEKARLFKIAITEAQTAQMWAVKAITWQY